LAAIDMKMPLPTFHVRCSQVILLVTLYTIINNIWKCGQSFRSYSENNRP